MLAISACANPLFQSQVENLHDLQYLMGYNRFRTDPLSQSKPCNAIACRQDLDPDPEAAYPFGALDAKVSSVLSASRGGSSSRDVLSVTDRIYNKHPMVLARMGPSADDQPVFCWKKWDDLQHMADPNSTFNKRGHKYFHSGHPECFDFQWQALPPLPADNVILPGQQRQPGH